jgi:hypothetical protein
MPISMPCPGCGAKLKAPDAAAGRTLTCPSCKTPVLLPGEPLPPPPRRSAAPTTVQKPNRPTLARQAPPPEDDIPGLKPLDDLDVLEEVPEEEGVEALEEVPDEELDVLEEVGAVRPVRREQDYDWSRILRLGLIHVRARQGSHLGCYDLCDPYSHKRLGEAIEVRESTLMTAGAVLETTEGVRLELREGRYGDLLGMVRRPADMPIGSTLKIVDEKDRTLGKFERAAWKNLTERPRPIVAERGRELLIQPDLSRWRLVFRTEDGEEVGEMISESSYEGRGARAHWFAKGASCYLRFRSTLAAHPRDKLLFLAVSLAMDI